MMEQIVETALSTDLLFPLTYMTLRSHFSMESWSIQTLQPVFSITSLTRIPALPITQPTQDGDSEHVTSVLAPILTVLTTLSMGWLASFSICCLWKSACCCCCAICCCRRRCCCSGERVAAFFSPSAASPLSLLTAFFATFLTVALPGTPLSVYRNDSILDTSPAAMSPFSSASSLSISGDSSPRPFAGGEVRTPLRWSVTAFTESGTAAAHFIYSSSTIGRSILPLEASASSFF
mmetsp:Transcript_29789/g.59263  ORF Transcript_29789/g.59263 Transcript_29789/m.59263 type:complete len:235 (-) Transcript_29789:41-745(-)